MEQIGEILNSESMELPKGPQPDPAWDYAVVWGVLNESKEGLDQLTQLLSETENAHRDIDLIVISRLNWLQSRLKTAQGLLTPPSDNCPQQE